MLLCCRAVVRIRRMDPCYTLSIVLAQTVLGVGWMFITMLLSLKSSAPGFSLELSTHTAFLHFLALFSALPLVLPPLHYELLLRVIRNSIAVCPAHLPLCHTGFHGAPGSLPPETVPALGSWDTPSFPPVLEFLFLLLLCWLPLLHWALRIGICPQGFWSSLLWVASSMRPCPPAYHHRPATHQ